MSKQLNHFQTVEWSSQLSISEECGAFVSLTCYLPVHVSSDL
jgi:hypothetical protein